MFKTSTRKMLESLIKELGYGADPYLGMVWTHICDAQPDNQPVTSRQLDRVYDILDRLDEENRLLREHLGVEIEDGKRVVKKKK